MADWYFRNNQSGLKACPGCRNLVRSNEEFCPYCAKRLREEGGARGLFKRIQNMPLLSTRILLGLMILGFMLQILADMRLPARFHTDTPSAGLGSILVSQMLTYYRLGSNFHPYVAVFGEVWRFVTYCFLHFGLIHILFNGYAFWSLGPLAERLWGGRQVFATFILAGIAGGAASFGWNQLLGKVVTSAGASGAICGILGLLLGAYYRNKFHVGQYLGGQLIQWAVMIIAFGLLMGADNAAHIGGMVAGGLLGYFMPPTQSTKTPGRDAKIWNTLAVVALLALLTSVGFAAHYYFQGPEYAAKMTWAVAEAMGRR